MVFVLSFEFTSQMRLPTSYHSNVEEVKGEEETDAGCEALREQWGKNSFKLSCVSPENEGKKCQSETI